MMLQKHIDNFITSGIGWLFRIRPVSGTLFATGTACLGFSLTGGFGIKGAVPTVNGAYTFDFSSGGGAPAPLIWASGILGVLMILLAIYMVWQVFRREQRAADRKKIIVIELRGLRDGAGTPLAEFVTDAGQCDSLLLDVRQGLQDGLIVDPVRAVEKISRIRDDLAQREGGRERADLKRIFGGLAPVPLTFLAGVLLDDEEATAIWDWSRHEKKWLALNQPDNRARFVIEGLEELVQGDEHVALLVSTSYDLDHAGIEKQIGTDMRRVQMRLDDAGPDAHWSEEKQRALGAQFFQAIQTIGNKGTQHIHLFLAAQSSLVFRFGTLYDKRNLPTLWVYQYDRSVDPPYPWAVEMPVGETGQARIQRFPSDLRQSSGM